MQNWRQRGISATPIQYLVHLTSSTIPKFTFRPKVLTSLFSNTDSIINDQKSGPMKEFSFVQQKMRPVAIHLHIRDHQISKNNQTESILPPRIETSEDLNSVRVKYLQFLVDSLAVHNAFEEIMRTYPALAPLRETGLERSKGLHEDIAWISNTYFPKQIGIESNLGEASAGKRYAGFLHHLAAESIPKFICHYYNYYFAHTAGGRAIGTRMAEIALNNKVLRFYQWDGDVEIMLDKTRHILDRIVASWSVEEKQHCINETKLAFDWGKEILAPLKEFLS